MSSLVPLEYLLQRRNIWQLDSQPLVSWYVCFRILILVQIKEDLSKKIRKSYPLNLLVNRISCIHKGLEQLSNLYVIILTDIKSMTFQQVYLIFTLHNRFRRLIQYEFHNHYQICLLLHFQSPAATVDCIRNGDTVDIKSAHNEQNSTRCNNRFLSPVILHIKLNYYQCLQDPST